MEPDQTSGELEPLNISCTSSNCDAGTHCFRPNGRKSRGKKLGVKEAQALLHGKTWSAQQELLFAHCQINWSRDYATHLKRGACIVPGTEERAGQNGPVMRQVWTVDREIPVFTADRTFIERFLSPAEAVN